MATVSLRIDQDLARQAEREAKVQNRSKVKQLEYWARLGKAISSKINIADAFAVSQGIKTIKLELLPSAQQVSIDPDLVFSHLENDRTKGFSPKELTSAAIYYEASSSHPGSLDRVNTTTNERQTGSFKNGKFIPR